MKKNTLLGMTLALGMALIAPVGASRQAIAAEHFVYNIYKALDFGNPGETPQKDYYVNMGSSSGLKAGSTIQVMRKQATYDMTSQKLYKDIVFPVATLKVIHVESNAAIARLDKLASVDESPATTPRAVMVGDLVHAQ